jgi:hypothetical protein
MADGREDDAAQAEYLEVAAGALSQGTEAMAEQLAETGRRADSVDSLLALVRLRARTGNRLVRGEPMLKERS